MATASTGTRPGEVVDKGPFVREIDFRPCRMRVSTDRYHSRDFAEAERENFLRSNHPFNRRARPDRAASGEIQNRRRSPYRAR